MEEGSIKILALTSICTIHEAVYSSCNIELLQFRVEVFASLQGSSQHYSLWADPHVLLRPAEELSLRLTESLQLGECWLRGGLSESLYCCVGIIIYLLYSPPIISHSFV